MEGCVPVGKVAELDAEGYLVAECDGREILVVRSQGCLFAIDNECPHMGSQLQRGRVEGGKISCPWHRATFDLATGKSESLFAGDLATYPVFTEGPELYVLVAAERSR